MSHDSLAPVCGKPRHPTFPHDCAVAEWVKRHYGDDAAEVWPPPDEEDPEATIQRLIESGYLYETCQCGCDIQHHRSDDGTHSRFCNVCWDYCPYTPVLRRRVRR